MSYALTTENVNDSKIDPVLFRDIKDRNVLFSVADATYDSQHIYEIAQTYDIFIVNPNNPRDGERFEQQFSKLRDTGLEQPRWYSQNRYLLHSYFSFATSSNI
ncbi:hypothetical protein BK708_11885 [Bacillus thuringiensis serovar yunnanensis]|nr:hypothetical protein BK708_11885 [Bacillus thuringiensis serovar yunnanensis]